MPVTANSSYYASYSPAQPISNNVASSYGRIASPTLVEDEPSYYSETYHTPHERGRSNHETEHARSPKRSPSLFRRINAAMRSKSSPSTPKTAQDSSTRGTSSRITHGDPMYAAPPTAGPSRLSGLPMNPVSRFRKSRNAEKTLRRDHEREVERTRAFPPEEWRVDERAGQSSSSLSRTQSDVRGLRGSETRKDVHLSPGTSSKHARAESEGSWIDVRVKHAPPMPSQTSEPLPRNKSPLSPSANSPVPREAGRTRQRSYLPAERTIPERSRRKGDTQPDAPSSPPRMGRYGIYASPPPSSPQTFKEGSRDQGLSDRSSEPAGKKRYAPLTRRVDGWDVQIAPPTSSPPSARDSDLRSSPLARRPTQSRMLSAKCQNLTPATDHPLMDGHLSSPPDPSDTRSADEFARNLTKRMSVLLNLDDVDFSSSSNPSSDPTAAAAHSPSPSSSGTVTPTGRSAVKRSAVEGVAPLVVEESKASGSTDTDTESSSPFGTFLINAREMNDAFVRGTGSIWDKLFSRDKPKEKEKEVQSEVPVEAETNHGDPKADNDEETEMEGSRDIMLYSPLIPDADSFVELAASEVVTLYGDGMDESRERAYRAELRRRWADGRGFVSFDALSSIAPVEEESGEPSDERIPAERGQANHNPETPNATDGVQVVEGSAKPKPKEKVIWVPSPTQISVQVLWWGYRIYLPPPVLHVLNARTIETAKRAALLTGALTWLLENLPLGALPVALAPAALLLKALVPLLGMIGSFIAWSWKATVTFDRGNGVVLSATWILPIVLVPGTWEDWEVSPPPPPPPPPP